MDNEKPDTGPAVGKAEPAGRGLPKSGAFSVAAKDPPPESKAVVALTAGQGAPSSEADDRSGVFRQLVTSDGDIAGLVAYSIYKQNKLDWLNAFEKSKGRAPNADELASYIIGEGTPRRIATYRHLAEATLAGNGPDIGGSGIRSEFRRAGGFGDKGALSPVTIAVYGAIAVVALIVLFVAAHYTMTSR